jgi:hypothetical protein
MAALFAVLVLAWSAGSIDGYVVHPDTSDFHAHADVRVVLRSSAGQERHATTNERGRYVFDGLPDGRYSLEVQLGRATVQHIFDLENDGTGRINVRVDPARDGRIVLTATRPIGATPSPWERRFHARSQAQQRRGCARFYRAWARVYRQKARQDARQDAAAARKRARRET